MLFSALFNNLSEEEKNQAIENIVARATPRQDFFLMMALALSMAAFGVLLNNIVILIGSMLIAPMLYPLLSFALGIVVADQKLIGRSVYTLLKSVGLALFAGFVIGFFFAPRGIEAVYPIGIVVGGSESLMYALVAVIAGFAAAFSMVKPHLSETLPGVAISVTLVPPLAVAGVGAALFDAASASNAILLFLVNAIGIVFSALIVFSLLRFGVKKTVTAEVVKEEEKVIKEEARSPSES